MMKYRVGSSSTMPTYTANISCNTRILSLIKKTDITVKGIIKNSTPPKCLGNLLVKSCCCWLIKTLSALYVTLFHLVSNHGTKINVKIKDIEARIGIRFTNKSEREAPPTIPIQNIAFQKLSLLHRVLNQLIISCPLKLLLQISVLILAFFKKLSKEITALMLILMMLYSNSVVLAQDLTQEDLALIINKFEQ